MARTGMNLHGLMTGWRGRSAALPAPPGDVTLHSFHGGLMLAGQKQAAELPILDIALPDILVLPLVNYRRELLTPHVQVGDTVAGGETVAAGVVAGTSGSVIAIESRAFIHPSGGQVPCVVVRPDQKDTIAGLTPAPELTIERLLAAGVQGMGGAGFAAADKIRAIADGQVSLLVINAAECEPGIACDAGLMQASAAPVLHGIRQLMALTRCQRCMIAIEDTSTDAIASLQAALHDDPRPGRQPELVPIPARYPSGAEATLLQLLSGRRLHPDERPTDYGMLCLNVATAFACSEAVRGNALRSRIMSVGGDAVAEPRNVRVRFGTLVSHVLRQMRWQGQKGPNPDEAQANTLAPGTKLLAGGPLGGFELASADVPVTATTNCLTLNRPVTPAVSRECIRCSECADVCPANLMPQQLYRYARNGNTAQLKRFSLASCITCGCCDLVCPSAIALTATFRHAQSHAREQSFQEREAGRLASLYEARESRLQRQATQREAERARRRQQLDTPHDPVAAALARARARRSGSRQAGPES